MLQLLAVVVSGREATALGGKYRLGEGRLTACKTKNPARNFSPGRILEQFLLPLSIRKTERVKQIIKRRWILRNIRVAR